VLATEDDLIAAYVKGELPVRDRQMFERNFLMSVRRQRRLDFISSLIASTAAATLGPLQRVDTRSRTALRVFLCGTHEDLAEEREAVTDCFRRMKVQYDSMEWFGARTNSPIATCLREVRLSDVVVLLVGYTYGSWVHGLNLSYTEAEYQEAIRLGKPCLVYLRDESSPILPTIHRA
jgi:Domain of unknown function (DUF4062)